MESPSLASDSEQCEVEEKLPEWFAIIFLGDMLMNASSWLLRQEYPVISSYVCGMSLMWQITILKSCLQFSLLVANDSGRSWDCFVLELARQCCKGGVGAEISGYNPERRLLSWLNSGGELELLGPIKLFAGARRWCPCHQIMKVVFLMKYEILMYFLPELC